MKSFHPIVSQIARDLKPRTVLDMPSGGGWVGRSLQGTNARIDGIDLFDGKPNGYGNFLQADLDYGIPDNFGKYDLIVSCEGFEHFANPGLVLKTMRDHLEPGGSVIISTPNTWHAVSRMKLFLRGFYPGFPPLAGKIKRGSHMHIMPWSWPQLHLYLTLAGFRDIKLHPVFEPRGTRLIDRFLGLATKAYGRKHARRAQSPEVKEFWETCISPGSLYAQRLVVSAKGPA